MLDANVFIEAHRFYHAFDLVPSFWACLEEKFRSGEVGSVQRVRDELLHKDKEPDRLVDWVQKLDKTFWAAPGEQMLNELQLLARWAYAPEREYRSAAVEEFLGSADLYLIAEASAQGATVVTREQPAPNSQKRIKIRMCALPTG
ncbi:MAG: DUF4411 family protein [Arachnia propionica]|uniref:DUF4411 family protein n=1 Tax=Arachnia propionica TaxID=1750 RepID=UPI002706D493|nr:DUF4411 family protein [Arachnia propionica]